MEYVASQGFSPMAREVFDILWQSKQGILPASVVRAALDRPDYEIERALFELFEAQLDKHQGHLVRAAVELAKAWRTERSLRQLEALLAVADKSTSLIITGNGDVIEPEDNLIAIGSGGPFAQSAARALLDNTEMDARTIVTKGLGIAGDICIYTNHNQTIEQLDF